MRGGGGGGQKAVRQKPRILRVGREKVKGGKPESQGHNFAVMNKRNKRDSLMINHRVENVKQGNSKGENFLKSTNGILVERSYPSFS